MKQRRSKLQKAKGGHWQQVRILPDALDLDGQQDLTDEGGGEPRVGMSKRFTATEKWSDKWFRKLSPTLKLGYLYLLDSCDAAGVIELDEDLANFQVGVSVDWTQLVDSAGDRIKQVGDGKLWIVKFLSYQYGSLSYACPAHRPAILCIEKHDLTQYLPDSFLKAIGKVLEKEKEKEKDNTKTRGGTGGKRFRKPTVSEVAGYCRERQNGIDPEAFVAFYESKGWKVGDQPMRSWKGAIVTWEKRRAESSEGDRNGAVSELTVTNEAMLEARDRAKKRRARQ